ncbi:MAG: hypothetical protein DYG93_05805 [Leptolyngbya sp. PLA2]|nr:hypothetical protein [Leptolyngbya sp.]MCE7971164.1 hypothetical protein [Leptolyngbya sp. PL-A2]MCQ3940843.1 hypothetical protein [cyanobacterium CYA1]MCZ7634135.1 hypothetical protein [Phycisphaerales bacterium]MDL1905158.1 hypothetical protein [Synechococcales cyanobacterium CNB]
MSITPPPFRTARRLAAALLSASAIVLASCGERESQAGAAVRDASYKLAALNAGVGNDPVDEHAVRVYTSVRENLKRAATSGSADETGAAAILVSHAERGLAAVPAAEHMRLEREAAHQKELILAEHRAWIGHSALAVAAATYDPANDLAEIERQVRERQAEVEKERARQAELTAKVEQLRSRARALQAEARQHRDEVGRLELRVPTVSDTEGLELVKQAREHRRKADGLELQAQELVVEADLMMPEVNESGVIVEKLLRQIESLGEVRVGVQARGRTAQEQATAARADAQAAAQRLAALLEGSGGEPGLHAFRQARLVQAYDEASRGFDASASEARKGMTADRAGAQLAVGQARQAAGDLHWNRARGLASFAELLEALVGSTPAVPNADRYRAWAAEARQAEREALERAAQAYSDAREAYGATGARGEARERLERVTRQLELLTQSVGGSVVDSSAFDAQAPAAVAHESSGDTGATPSGGGDLAAEIDRVIALVNEGRYLAALEFVHPATDADLAFVQAVRPAVEKQERLDRITREKFGASFTDYVAENPAAAQGMVGGMGDLGGGLDVRGVRAADLDIRVQGDEGLVLAGNGQRIPFRRIDGSWRLIFSINDLGLGGPEMQQMMGMMEPMMRATAQVYDDLAGMVERGELQSNQAVMAAMQNKMMQVMMELMGQMQPPGGG